jgi:HAD superfamily hydrolase (TIGR01509 family)
MSIRAVVFDFDGVILDTETPEFEAWADVFRAHGHEMPVDQWVANIGLRWGSYSPSDDLAQRVGTGFDREAANARRRAQQYAAIDASPVMPGVLELVTQAKAADIGVAIASSSPRRWLRQHLEPRGLLSHFGPMFCAEDVAATKPAPDLYLAACHALGVAPHEAIAVEDSPNGATAALTAGLFTVVVRTPMMAAQPFDNVHLVVDTLADWPLTRLMEVAEVHAGPA